VVTSLDLQIKSFLFTEDEMESLSPASPPVVFWGLSLLSLKLTLAGVILVVGVLGVLSPKLLFRTNRGYGLGLSMGNMFSAGGIHALVSFLRVALIVISCDFSIKGFL
jgi:hypothetical protein